MPTKRRFTKLGRALDERTADWMAHTEPVIYSVIADEVADGAHPDEIAQFVRDHVGDHREGLIAAIRGTARHLSGRDKV